MKYTPSQIREKADLRRASAVKALKALLPPQCISQPSIESIVSDIVECAMLEISAAQLEVAHNLENPLSGSNQ